MSQIKSIKNLSSVSIEQTSEKNQNLKSLSITSSVEPESVADNLPMARDRVDGRRIKSGEIPNLGSIASTLSNYEIVPGIREVSMNHFSSSPPYSVSEFKKAEALSKQIEESQEITPLIVVEDAEGFYILEGGHRFDALNILKAKSFPALVVKDMGSKTDDWTKSSIEAAAESFLPEDLIMVDLEMTGVVPDRDKILQIAMLRLKLNGDQYDEVGEPLVLYLQHDGEPENDFHREHLEHIFKQCNESKLQPLEAKELISEWLGDLKGKVTPCGDCVHTDLAFLHHHGVIDRGDIIDGEPAPGTLHYEAFDLNPLKAMARQRTGRKEEKRELAGYDEENVHDALTDCKNQLLELNHYMQILLPKTVAACVFADVQTLDNRPENDHDFLAVASNEFCGTMGAVWTKKTELKQPNEFSMGSEISPNLNAQKSITIAALSPTLRNFVIPDLKVLNLKTSIQNNSAVLSAKRKPFDLPEEVMPSPLEDFVLDDSKRAQVLGFEGKARGCVTFQDFQELLSKILFELQLPEDYRKSVAGILNRTRHKLGLDLL